MTSQASMETCGDTRTHESHRYDENWQQERHDLPYRLMSWRYCPGVKTETEESK